MAPKGKEQSGALVRAANGDLYFLRDNDDVPIRIPKESELAKAFDSHRNLKQAFGDELPPEVLKLLRELFGPLIGAWWWRGGPGLRR